MGGDARLRRWWARKSSRRQFSLKQRSRGSVLEEDIPPKIFLCGVSLCYGRKGSLMKWVWKTLDKCDFSASFQYYHPSGREKMWCFPKLI